MSAKLEKAVRPFQLPQSAGVRRIPSEQIKAVEEVVLRAGRTGSGKQMQGSASLNVSYYCEAHQNEQRRRR